MVARVRAALHRWVLALLVRVDADGADEYIGESLCGLWQHTQPPSDKPRAQRVA